MEQNEDMVQRGNMERNELVRTIALVKKEVEKSQEELNRMKFLKNEKEKAFSLLQAEVEALKVQCNDLKHSLFGSEQEKETLWKLVFLLEVELKKEEAFTDMEKKLNESNKRTTSSDGTEITVKNNKPASVSHGTKEVANLKEKIKSLEGQIESKEITLGTSTLSFLEKERDLHKIMEELESRVEELNQSNANFCNNPHQMLAESTDDITSNGFVAEDLNSTGLISKKKGNGLPSANSKDTVSLDEEMKTPEDNTGVCNNDTLTELSSLKERNQSMESELNEMQNRYSAMSLRFAEVEGEKQKLAMTLRNRKNGKKG
uniref:Uncharacterized protein MANES_02G023900 n=1 Tax=Rhizophora mucronata TaxID=61149 RepID=A0A2P2KWS8_RHIMU